MYLLKLQCIAVIICSHSLFTFHHVSIKTSFLIVKDVCSFVFTFHHVSIKTNITHLEHIQYIVFTFHHVSIKTRRTWENKKARKVFTFHHVSIKTASEIEVTTESTNSHSTMYLLKPELRENAIHRMGIFTFHHVSIKT